MAASDPTADTDASIATSVALPGDYYLEVSGVGNGNYTDYASAGQYFISGAVAVEAVANVPPTADFGHACAELTCSFSDASSDSDGSIAAYAWDFGDGTSSTARNPSHTYAAGGIYSVTLTVTDDDGASSVATADVTVVAPNRPPVADFGVSCNGLTCSFNDASSDSDGDIVAWAWEFGDGNTSSASDPTHSYASDGSYAVTLTVTDHSDASATTSATVDVSTLTDQVVLFADDFADGDAGAMVAAAVRQCCAVR